MTAYPDKITGPECTIAFTPEIRIDDPAMVALLESVIHTAFTQGFTTAATRNGQSVTYVYNDWRAHGPGTQLPGCNGYTGLKAAPLGPLTEDSALAEERNQLTALRIQLDRESAEQDKMLKTLTDDASAMARLKANLGRQADEQSNRTAELNKRETKLEDIRHELSERDEDLVRRRQNLDERERQLDARAKSLSERERIAAATDKDLGLQRASVLARENAAYNREQRIIRMEEVLDKREKAAHDQYTEAHKAGYGRGFMAGRESVELNMTGERKRADAEGFARGMSAGRKQAAGEIAKHMDEWADD